MKPEVEQFHARVHNVLIVEKTVKSWHDETLRRLLYVKCEDCEVEGLSKERAKLQEERDCSHQLGERR